LSTAAWPPTIAGVVSANVAALMKGVLQAMVETRIKIATTILLVALTCSGVCLTGYSRDAGNEDAKEFAGETKTVMMFPDGLEYDFGKVQRGILAKHVFRVVNTSSVPLQIISLHKT
jgi:hypothetical protein